MTALLYLTSLVAHKLFRVLSRKFLLGRKFKYVYGLYRRSVKILQRVHVEMYNRHISYQNALLNCDSNKTDC